MIFPEFLGVIPLGEFFLGFREQGWNRNGLSDFVDRDHVKIPAARGFAVAAQWISA